MNGPSKLGYIPALDGLRGLSILAVMFHHIDLPWFRVGFLGVDVFFVLSGFLITSLLVQEWQAKGSIDLPHFYYRRALRLLPALICFIIVSIVLVTFFGTPSLQSATWTGVWSSLLYVSNWTNAASPDVSVGMLSGTWSLAIEDQFYIVWALSLPFLLAHVRRSRLLIGLGAAALASTYMCYLHLTTLGGPKFAYMGSDSRAVALIAGCMLAIIYTSGKLPTGRAFRLICFALVSAGLVFAIWVNIITDDPVPRFSLGGFALIAASSAALITLSALVRPTPRLLEGLLKWKPLVWVGSISYGLYLWHGLVLWGFDPTRLGIDPFIAHTLAIIFSFVVAYLSFRFIERRFLRLRYMHVQLRRPATQAPTNPA